MVGFECKLCVPIEVGEKFGYLSFIEGGFGGGAEFEFFR